MEVTNCFAVPHAERDEEVAIGKDFNRQMLALHYRANRNETVVGWYATAFPQTQEDNAADPHSSNRCLANTSSLIHEFYTGECEDSVMDSPIHLVVDTSLVNDAIALKGYISSAVTLNGEPLANMFHEVRLLLKSSESERIVMDEMIKAMGGASSTTAATPTDSTFAKEGKDNNEEKIADNTNPLQVSLEKLLEMLDIASEYVGNVVSGKLTADDAVGNEIADTLSSIPRIRPEVFDKMFNESMQDMLMVSYLSNITRTQLKIADKLNQALDQEA